MKDNIVKQKIKLLIAENGYSFRQIVNELNKNRPANEQIAPSSFSNKLSRGSIRFVEVMEIADILGYTVEFIPKDGRKVYFPAAEEATNEKQDHENEFMESAEKGSRTIDSKNFGHAVVVGENAELASIWLGEKMKSIDSKVNEILLYVECQKIFEVIVHPTNV